jgi:hypothetical protein
LAMRARKDDHRPALSRGMTFLNPKLLLIW